MKVSVKLEDPNGHHNHQTPTQNQNPLLIRAKIPITVFGLPFLSAFSATHHHSTSDNLSLSLRTHFNSGPSLKLSYNTPAATSPATPAAAPPVTLTLKSGVSLFGSPNNSPLVISANFSISPHNRNPNPTFTLQFKPRLGAFSLRKSVSSNPNPNDNKKLNVVGVADNNENSFGFVPLDKPINWKELTVDSATKGSILSGILVMANTELPVTKRFSVNLRWGVGVPQDYGKQLPFLSLNKIKIQRVEEVEEKGVKEKENEAAIGEFDMLKGMHSWMSRQFCDLQRENREMKQMLEEMKSGQLVRSNHGYGGGGGGGGGRRAAPVVENSGGFEQWRNKKNGGSSGEESLHRDTKSNLSSISDVESELQRAIKAASS